MSKIHFYEQTYNQYMRKISHEYKLFSNETDKYNYNEGNHNYTIKKPRLFYLCVKIFIFCILCVWFYVDVLTDIFLCYLYANQSKWFHFALTLTFIMLPILVSTVNESKLLLTSRKYASAQIIAYRKTKKTKCEIFTIFMKKILLLDMPIK